MYLGVRERQLPPFLGVRERQLPPFLGVRQRQLPPFLAPAFPCSRLSLERGRLLVVAHSEEGETIRIISARPAQKGDRKIYEKG